MNDTIETPVFGTDEHRWWAAGAAANEAAHKGALTDENREVAEFVEVCAEQGYTGDRIVEYAAAVWGPSWPLRRRLSVAWRLVRTRSRRWSVDEVYIPRAELGIGVRWYPDDDGMHVTIALLGLVVRLRRRS